MRTSTWRTPANEMRVSFLGAETREDFRAILCAVRERLSGSVLQEIDGPDSSLAQIEIGETRGWLICNEDLGIFLKGDPELSEKALQDMAEQLAVWI